jgi:hypothetical protein
MNRFSLVNVVAAIVVTATQWTAFFNPTAPMTSPRAVAASVADDSMPVVVVTARGQSYGMGYKAGGGAGAAALPRGLNSDPTTLTQTGRNR